MWQTYFFMSKTPRIKTDSLLGAFFLAFALITLFVWIPQDVDTGLVERVRRRNVIGDALGPTIAMILVALAAVSLIRTGRKTPLFETQSNLYLNLTFYVSVFVIALVVMRYLGPLSINILNMFLEAEWSYRNLRNVWPLKYVGYVAGGTLLMSAFSHFMDSGLTKRRVLLFLGISLTIAMFFDLPFEDILLPPNGDV